MVLELVHGKLPWGNFALKGSRHFFILKKIKLINETLLSVEVDRKQLGQPVLIWCPPGDVLELKVPESHMSCRPNTAGE